MGMLWGKRVRLAAIGSERLVTRGGWAAEPARRRRTRRGALRMVVLHHTRLPSGQLEPDRAAEAAYLRELQARHFALGFSDVGYHFVVVPSGRIYLGRPVWALGAHVQGHNNGTVGIALAGDFDTERPTEEAIDSAAWAIRRLVARSAGVPVLGHGDLAPKDCPGRLLYPRIEQLGAGGDLAPTIRVG